MTRSRQSEQQFVRFGGPGRDRTDDLFHATVGGYSTKPLIFLPNVFSSYWRPQPAPPHFGLCSRQGHVAKRACTAATVATLSAGRNAGFAGTPALPSGFAAAASVAEFAPAVQDLEGCPAAERHRR